MNRIFGYSLLLGGLGLALLRRKFGSSEASMGNEAASTTNGGSAGDWWPGLRPAQRARVAGFEAAWRRERVPLELQMAFVANALEESGIELGRRSAMGLADDSAGGSWTAFQILQPAVARAATALGLSYQDVVPKQEPTGADLTRVAVNQARVALHVARAEMNHRWNADDPEMSAFDLFSRWAAGPSWSAARVLAAPGVMRVLNGRLPSEATRESAVQSLRAAGLSISAGALEKLGHFRRFRRAHEGVV